MPYITVPFQDRNPQISLEDLFLNDDFNFHTVRAIRSPTSTVTRYFRAVPEHILRSTNILGMIGQLQQFNQVYTDLFDVERRSLYNTFFLDKKSGGKRRIDAPCERLMDALRDLQRILESFGALYHTSCFSYLKGRNTLQSVQRHQGNGSWWFLKLDFHDFFGSTTQDFVMRMFSNIYPFSEILLRDDGRAALSRALSLCFLNGGLPQGTPISPFITNTMMIPIDHVFCNRLTSFRESKYVYTRYADDLLISSKRGFDYQKVQEEIINILRRAHAPFVLNTDKTRYGNRSGSNFNLGVVLNKDNEITVGWRNHEAFRHMINNYLYDRMNGRKWLYNQLSHMNGLLSYYKMIEPDWVQRVTDVYNSKYSVNLKACIKFDLKYAH